MAAELIVTPEAAQDIAEAYDWYESRRFGLGEEFLSRVDACVEATPRNPRMHPVVHESYRRAVVRRYPYVIFYEFADGVITVHCVFHTSRDPAKWRQRLP